MARMKMVKMSSLKYTLPWHNIIKSARIAAEKQGNQYILFLLVSHCELKGVISLSCSVTLIQTFLIY
ncbi:hypothetical protein BRARA_G00413 [Brassica rapa]|uniref:Uncharacterized protein n=1 Tax=Brassica campestris TaxID=3711 RepID=A0A397YLZ9_BRACM|nr:hypothetical protein BRARA_G00413 [Brassica rapa]